MFSIFVNDRASRGARHPREKDCVYSIYGFNLGNDDLGSAATTDWI